MNNRSVVTGNLAYKLDYEEQKIKKPLRTTKTQQVKKQAAKKVNLAVLLFYMVIIGAMAFCLIGREVKLYAKSSELSAMESELTNLQAKSKQIMMEAEAVLDFNAIEQTAMEEYNMKRPETHQVVYVDMQKDDYIEGGKNNEETGVQKVLGIIKNW